MLATIAGNGTQGFSGDNGVATASFLHNPSALAVSSNGDLYIADSQNNCVRKVDHEDGVITTIVGTGSKGFSGDGGPAIQAELNHPAGLAVAANGDLYIADSLNHRVRKVRHHDGIISSIAGTGERGFSGDNGPAGQAQLRRPRGLAIQDDSFLYLADFENERIRTVDLRSGVIRTVAGNGEPGFFGDGGAAIEASLNGPTGIAVAPSGDLFIADCGNDRVRKVDKNTRVITTVAGSGYAGFSGEGELATQARLNDPTSVAVAPNGDLYIADKLNNRIRLVDRQTGSIVTVAGTGEARLWLDRGQATHTQLSNPVSVVLAGAVILVADSGNNCVRAIVTPRNPRSLKDIAAYIVKQDPGRVHLTTAKCPRELLEEIENAQSSLDALTNWPNIQQSIRLPSPYASRSGCDCNNNNCEHQRGTTR